MSTYWRKLGLLYTLPPEGVHPLLQSHVANPLPIHLHGDVYRIFYSARDRDKRSSVGGVDIDIVTPQVVRAHPEPVFRVGPAGPMALPICCLWGGRIHLMGTGVVMSEASASARTWH